MLNANDREKVVKASQSMNLAVQDLRELVKASDPLLSDAGLDLLKQAVEIGNRLKRIEAITGKSPRDDRDEDVPPH